MVSTHSQMGGRQRAHLQVTIYAVSMIWRTGKSSAGNEELLMTYLLLCGSACRLLGQEALRGSKAVPRGELREGPAALRLVARCFWCPTVPLHMLGILLVLSDHAGLMRHLCPFSIASNASHKEPSSEPCTSDGYDTKMHATPADLETLRVYKARLPRCHIRGQAHMHAQDACPRVCFRLRL